MTGPLISGAGSPGKTGPHPNSACPSDVIAIEIPAFHGRNHEGNRRLSNHACPGGATDLALEEGMNYQGYYINLDRNPDRNTAIEAELKRFNVRERYQRFPAVDGHSCGLESRTLSAGEVGCYLSHYRLLEQNLSQPSNLHVMEDDVLFSKYASGMLAAVATNNFFGQFDIVYTDVFVPIDIEAIASYKKIYGQSLRVGAGGERSFSNFQVLDLSEINFASAASFLVNGNSISKLCELYRRHLESGITLPIDLLLRNLVLEGKIKAACIFPFVTSVRPESLVTMNMEGRYKSNLSVLVSFLLRYSFFVDCDWEKCTSLLPSDSLCDENDPHKKTIMSVIKFRLFGDYQVF
jgi:GR25 family glycosyltransferase involved in LPS biosynthesis